jgi:putative nucleotidyltransferase-like protein
VFELLASAFNPATEPLEWQAKTESVDQDALVIYAIVLGLAPLLHWRITSWKISIAPRALAKLAAVRENARAQRQALDLQLDGILDALAADHIIPFLLKGNYLAVCVYPEPHLRQMNDIDLLVNPDEIRQTEAVLMRLGYIGSFKSPDRGAGVTKHTSTFRPPRGDDPTPNPYLSSVAGRTVEPHTSLEESWYGLHVDITPGVRERGIPVQANGRVARALSPDDLVLHLAVHLTFHLIMGYPSMVQLVDILFVTQQLGTEIHWDDVVGRARRRGAAPFVYAALRLASMTLAAPVPGPVLGELASLCPARVRGAAKTLTLKNVMTRTQRAPVTTLAQRLRRGWQDRAEVARWAGTPAEQWKIWRTLLDVAHTDTGELLARRLHSALART